MRRILSAVLLVVASGAAHAQATGSTPSPLQPGTRIRTSVAGVGTVTGRVVGVTGDTLRVARDGTADTMSVARSSLTWLDVSTSQHKRRWVGAGVGFLAGAALGGIIGAATYQEPTCAPDAWFCDFGGRGMEAAGDGILLGSVGAIVGAIVGAGRADTWQPVDPHQSARLQLTVPRAAGRYSLGATLRF